MLAEREVREMSARRTWAVLPAVACAIVAVFLYLIGMGDFRESLISWVGSRFGDTIRDMTPIALIGPAFVLFVLPSCLAAQYAGRFKTLCPSCNRDVSSATNRVLSTRCRPECGDRILDGGRTHSEAVHRRYQALRLRRFLQFWLWAWPAIGGVAVAWQLFDRSAFQQCPQCLWTAPLVGTAAAGWAWLRTFDRRYVLQLLASVILLGLGAVLFWQTL